VWPFPVVTFAESGVLLRNLAGAAPLVVVMPGHAQVQSWQYTSESPDLSARALMALISVSRRSGDDAEARTHQTDAVEIGLLAGALLGAFARLVAFVEQLDLLQFLEGFRQQRLGVLELNA